LIPQKVGRALVREFLQGGRILPSELVSTFSPEGLNLLFEGRFYHIQFGLEDDIKFDVSLKKYEVGVVS